MKITEKQLQIKMREAKSTHRQRLESAFKSNNNKKAWDTMKSMTGMSTHAKPIVTDNELEFANDLNVFFARFETTGSSDRCKDLLKNVTPVPSDRITITEDDVRMVFQRVNTRKASGPESCSAYVLKNFYRELAPVWQPLFQLSVDTSTVPQCWKTSHVNTRSANPLFERYLTN